LLNIKRLAYETESVPNRFERAAGTATLAAASSAGAIRPGRAPVGVPTAALTEQIERFLGTRGYKTEGSRADRSAVPPAGGATIAADTPLDFVCEQDVRLAIDAGRTLLVSERAIITPSARELGEARRVFTFAPYRG
jgi:hypothetical protein